MPITVELSVENTAKYFENFSLKELYKEHDPSLFLVYIFPREKEMLKYWKYRKCLKQFPGWNIRQEALFFNREEEFKHLKYKTQVGYDRSIIFEFPDDYPEEDLFYFKMKYC